MQSVQNKFSNSAAFAINSKNRVDSKTVSNLSEKAQDYLNELKKKYDNVDFIVADFSDDDEAQKYLAKGKGEYNCVITPETLEKMANDDEEKAKFEGIIEEAMGNLDSIKDKLDENQLEKVKSFGISVNDKGEVSYYAIIKDSLKVDESVQAAREKAKEKKAEQAEKQEKAEKKEQMLKASSMDELIELIKNLSDKKEDRVELKDKTDDAFKIDKVDFGTKTSSAIEEYIPTKDNGEHRPFDFKA